MSPARAPRGTLTAAAVKLAGLIGPDACVLIGGLAVVFHGYVRATDDIDFISREPLGVIRKRLLEARIDTRLLRGDVLDGGFSCLKGVVDGIPFDVLPPLVPIAWEHSHTLAVRAGALRVVELDGLIRLKFRAGGPQDLLDVVRLVLLHPEMEAKARELAVAHRELDRFEAFFNNPRVRAQAREEAELKRRAVGVSPKRGRPDAGGRRRSAARKPGKTKRP